MHLFRAELLALFAKDALGKRVELLPQHAVLSDELLDLRIQPQTARLGRRASLQGRVVFPGDQRKLRRPFKFAWSRDSHSPSLNPSTPLLIITIFNL